MAGASETTSRSDPSPDADLLVHRFVRRAMLLLMLRYSVQWSAGWLLAWGVLVLTLRATVEMSRWHLAWGAAGLVAVLTLAGWQAWRRRPRPAAVRAMLDGRGRLGGLLMAREEHDTARWQGRVEALPAVDVRWRGRRAVAVLVLALTFVAAGFAVPDRFTRAATRPMDVSAPASRLAEQLDLLAEEELLEQEEAERLVERLEQLEAQAEGRDPVRTWEALDHLRERAEQAGAEAAEDAIQETADLTQAQSLAEALADEGVALDPGLRAEAMQSLAEMADRAAAEDASLREQLSEATREALERAEQAGQGGQAGQTERGEAGEMTAEQLRELAEALEGRKMAVAEMMERLAEMELTDARQLARAEAAGERPGDGEGLSEFLAEMEGGMSVQDAVARWSQRSGAAPGGGGDAPLTWKDQASSEDGSDFDPVVLPRADASALRESQMLGQSASAPEVEDADAAPASGALRAAEADGGSATVQRVLPRHRDSVHRYFERDQE